MLDVVGIGKRIRALRKAKGIILATLLMKGIIRQFNKRRKIISFSMDVSAKSVGLIFMQFMAKLGAIILRHTIQNRSQK